MLGVVSALLIASLFLVADDVLADDVFADHEANVPKTQVWGVLGQSTSLPCDAKATKKDDELLLVLWYKQGHASPIYTFDLRSSAAKHYVDRSVWGQRAAFLLNNASLTVASLKEEDEGLYRCRVDFRRSPTSNNDVHLNVIVPPSKPVLLDEEGSRVHDILGPLRVGQNFKLTCVNTGGSPSPTLSWWRNKRVLSDEDDNWNVENVAKAYNVAKANHALVLEVRRVDVRDEGAVLECRAVNNNRTAAAIATIQLLLALPPTEVSLAPLNQSLSKSEGQAVFSAGRTHSVQCVSKGSRPSPTFEWLLSDIPLPPTKASVLTSANASTLTFRPEADDDAKILICRVHNELFPDVTLESSLELHITHVPIVRLEFGPGLEPRRIKEGDDVYFECEIRAKPSVNTVIWRHNGQRVREDVSQGVLIGNRTLVLQSLSLARAGLYTCVASNPEGDAESNAQFLNIQYTPRCKSDQRSHYGMSLHESSEISCQVDSNPRPKHFKWALIAAKNKKRTIIEDKYYTIESDKSILKYSARRAEDLNVILQCWASNAIGSQNEPCQFTVVPQTRPEALEKCNVLSITAQTVHVVCEPGFDGGQNAQFHSEALLSTALLSNTTRSEPDFSLQNLAANTSYTLIMYASNALGAGPKLVLNVTTRGEKNAEIAAAAVGPVADEEQGIPDDASDPNSNKNNEETSVKQRKWALLPILIILLAVALGLCSLAIVVTFMAKGARNADEEHTEMNSKESSDYLINPQVVVNRQANRSASNKAVHFDDECRELRGVEDIESDSSLSSVLPRPPANFSDSPPNSPLLRADHVHRHVHHHHVIDHVTHRAHHNENAFVTFCPETLESRRTRLDVVNATRL